MTFHQSLNRLVCHHCGYSTALPASCPDCGQSEIRHYGVGTEQLQQFISQQFNVPVIRIDRDSVNARQSLETLLQPVISGEPCILVGTQMLAKGHDYPHITLVGILDADQALYSSNYRASERLIQTVLQVAGRAGRADKAGQAVLQTSFPAHELVRNLGHRDYSQLIEPILQERQLLGFPPYQRVISFVADALELDIALQTLQQVYQQVRKLGLPHGMSMIGPIPALMTRRVGRYRAQLSLVSADIRQLRSLLRQLLPQIYAIRNTGKLKLVVEIDPLDL